MKKLLYLVMLFPITVLGQIKFTGKVIDAVTKQPIPYTNLESFKYKAGTQSNQEGIFVLDLSKGKQTDTIKISCIGYLDKFISNLASGDNLTYELTPIVFQLNEVKIENTKCEEKEVGVLDITGRKLIFFNQEIQRPGLQRAVLIKNEGSVGYINILHFYMGKDMYEAPFRVHIVYYGPEIVQKFDSAHGLTYQKILGGKWQKLRGGKSDGRGKEFTPVLIDLLIKATIQVAK